MIPFLIEMGPRMPRMMGRFEHNPGILLVVQIIIIALTLLIVWWIFRGQTKRDYDMKDSPLEILKKRYAAGEITKKQFEEIKRDLK